MWLGDLNGDMLPDVLTANYGNSTISVLLGKAGGGFENIVNYAASANPVRIAVGDFDGDMKADIAVTNFSTGNPNTQQEVFQVEQGGGRHCGRPGGWRSRKLCYKR